MALPRTRRIKRGAHPLTLIGPVEKKMHVKGTLAQLRKATLAEWGKA